MVQVAREGFIIFFSEVFDAMFRLCADSETNVQNAVQFLDNLVKVRAADVTRVEHHCLASLPKLERMHGT